MAEEQTVQATPTETTTSVAPVENASTAQAQEQAATESKPIDPSTLKADELKDLINNPPKVEQKQEAAPDQAKQEEWFDKDRGFKTKDDMLKSYTEAQNKIRETSEQLKQFENFKAQAEAQLAELSKKAEMTPLSAEDQQKQAAIKQWQSENKESLDFIKNMVKQEILQEQMKSQIEDKAINDRKTWKSDFDKDDSRKHLWPKMEEVYAKKGDKIFQDFIHNPFPYLEAVAFKENFSSIADKIKAEAVEAYKAGLKQAAEAERSKSTATPGGLKSISGEMDVSKMSSSDIAALLPRGD
jgi:hypothetical protein